MSSLKSLVAACGVAAALASPGGPPEDRDRVELLAAVQKFFDGLAAHDAAAMSSVLLAGGQVQSVREENGQWTTRTMSFDESVRSMAANPARLLERFWKPEVRVFGRIATVTAPYDFHRDGAFSHCGTDIFSFVRTADGWRVSGLLYTVERRGCTPSPLGPPK